jgi:hypothetical protein
MGLLNSNPTNSCMCLNNQNTRRFIIRITINVRARALSNGELSIRSPMKVQHKSRYQCDRHAVGMNRSKEYNRNEERSQLPVCEC